MDEISKSRGAESTKVVDKILNVLFSQSKIKVYLLLFFLLGFVLRVIAAINIGVSADDMHHTVHAINFLKSGKLETWDQTGALWHCLTDISYRIFGISQFSSRFCSIFFGSISIILIFLFTKEFLDEKRGLISAFLLAVSPLFIRYSIAEQDVMVTFFILFSALFFVKAMKNNKNSSFITSGVLLGLGVLTKVYALLFVPSFIAFLLYKNYKKKKRVLDKETTKKMLILLGVIFIFCIPPLVHNYLLYKDKGIADFLFARTLGLGKEKSAQIYSWAAGWYDKPDWSSFFFGNSKIIPSIKTPMSIYTLGYSAFTDPIVFIFGVLGLIYCFFKKRESFVFLILMLIFAFPYLASMVYLPKHYLFFTIFLVTPATIFISKIKDKFPKLRLKYIFIFILIFNLIFLCYRTPHVIPHFYAKSEIQGLMEYTKNINKDSLVIADSRIYRGRIHWMLNGLNYVEAMTFLQLQDQFKNDTTSPISIETYFIECVTDDCGWGTIKGQSEFNQTMEYATEFFKSNSEVVEEVYSAEIQKYYFPLISKKEQLYFRVYKTNLLINPMIVYSLKSTRSWFLYPIGYDESIEPIFDKYTIHNAFDSLLDKIAHWIFYLAILFSFASIFFLIYLSLNKDET